MTGTEKMTPAERRETIKESALLIIGGVAVTAIAFGLWIGVMVVCCK